MPDANANAAVPPRWRRGLLEREPRRSAGGRTRIPVPPTSLHVVPSDRWACDGAGVGSAPGGGCDSRKRAVWESSALDWITRAMRPDLPTDSESSTSKAHGQLTRPTGRRRPPDTMPARGAAAGATRLSWPICSSSLGRPHRPRRRPKKSRGAVADPLRFMPGSRRLSTPHDRP